MTTQDYIDISQLYARYNAAIDDGDADAWVDTFTSDGVFNKLSGRGQLLKFATEDYTGRHWRHWSSNLIITPTPEGAAGTAHVLLIDVRMDPPSIARALRSEDLLVKTDSGWRFQSRRTRKESAPS